jgi:hypothetical protein
MLIGSHITNERLGCRVRVLQLEVIHQVRLHLLQRWSPLVIGDPEVAEAVPAPEIFMKSYSRCTSIVGLKRSKKNGCRPCTRSRRPSPRTCCTWGFLSLATFLTSRSSLPVHPSQAAGTPRRQRRHANPPCTAHRTAGSSVGTPLSLSQPHHGGRDCQPAAPNSL